VDGGQIWTIESVDDTGAVARLDAATRRFRLGAAVVTAGRQRGPLRVAEGAAAPSPASIVVYDGLRQFREQARKGKPAYVV
ncbi:MAG TPA: hypothetical protein PLV68_19585, partial [Ilumatobacteraceae bacterium]|nr:hypothetical protein [Ilumatobacteraceae bacterium]